MTQKLSRKYFLLAMAAILILGTATAFGLRYFLNQNRPKPLFLEGPVTSAPLSLNFNLTSPDDNLLIFDPNILVQGKTSPHATVIISAGDNNTVIEDTGQNGDFSSTVRVSAGLNQVAVVAFDAAGNSKRENRTVYYSTEKL